MPVLTIDTDTQIYYEVFGSGYPVLAFGPGNLRSSIKFWKRSALMDPAPWMDPTIELARNFKVIAMDQRHAGRSRGRLSATDDWMTYARDHVALMDHLGIERCHLIGGCIGSSFCLMLCKLIPERITSAVLQSPIGRSHDNGGVWDHDFQSWCNEKRPEHPEWSQKLLNQFFMNMYGSDFVFSVRREFMLTCQTPILAMPGRDKVHPPSIGFDLAVLHPSGEMLKRWYGAENRHYAAQAARDFLLRNTP